MTTTTEVYTVRVSREGKWWMIYIPALDAMTQARRLSEVENMARSLIAVTMDLPPEQVRFRTELEAIDDVRVTKRLEQLQADRRDAEKAQARFRERQRALARDLARLGLTVRDIGSVLGVSFQRAQQLLSDEQRRSA